MIEPTTKTARPKVAPAEPRCHFFRLPPELLLNIYELVLWPQPIGQRLEGLSTDPVVDNRFASQNWRGYHLTNRYRPPALLGVNTQVRAEASKTFYSDTLFFRHHLDHWTQSAMTSWSSSLMEVDRSFVARFCVDLRNEHVDDLDDDVDMGMISKFRDWPESEEIKTLLEIPVKDNEEPRGWRYAILAELLGGTK